MSVWVEIYSLDGIGSATRDEGLEQAELSNSRPLFSASVSTTAAWSLAWRNIGPTRVYAILRKPSADHLFYPGKTSADTPIVSTPGALFEADERLRRLYIESGCGLFVRLAQ